MLIYINDCGGLEPKYSPKGKKAAGKTLFFGTPISNWKAGEYRIEEDYDSDYDYGSDAEESFPLTKPTIGDLIKALKEADDVEIGPFVYDMTEEGDGFEWKGIRKLYYGEEYFQTEDGEWKDEDMDNYEMQADDDRHTYGTFLSTFFFEEQGLSMTIECPTSYAGYENPGGFCSEPEWIVEHFQNKNYNIQRWLDVVEFKRI